MVLPAWRLRRWCSWVRPPVFTLSVCRTGHSQSTDILSLGLFGRGMFSRRQAGTSGSSKRIISKCIVFDGTAARINGIIPVSSKTPGPEKMKSASEDHGDIATTKPQRVIGFSRLIARFRESNDGWLLRFRVGAARSAANYSNNRLHLRQENRPRGMNSNRNLL